LPKALHTRRLLSVRRPHDYCVRMRFVSFGRFILRFALVTIVLAWWCPFILGGRLRFLPASRGQRLASLKTFARRYALILAINLIVAGVVGHALGYSGSVRGLDFPSIAIASLMIVLLWRATEMVWSDIDRPSTHRGGGLGSAITREIATFAFHVVLVLSAIVVLWWLVGAIRPCLPVSDGPTGQCSLANFLRSAARYAYQSEGTGSSPSTADLDRTFRQGLIIGGAIYLFVLAFAMALVGRIVLMIQNLWYAVEVAESARRLSGLLGAGIAYALALAYCAVVYWLVLALRPCWHDALLGPLPAATCFMADRQPVPTAFAFPAFDGIPYYVPPFFMALAVAAIRFAWRRWGGASAHFIR